MYTNKDCCQQGSHRLVFQHLLLTPGRLIMTIFICFYATKVTYYRHPLFLINMIVFGVMTLLNVLSILYTYRGFTMVSKLS